jgi:hypothetical protein
MPITMTWGGAEAAQAGRMAGQADSQRQLWEDLQRRRANEIQHAIMAQHYGQQNQLNYAKLAETADYHKNRGDHLEAQLKQQGDQFGQTIEQHRAALKQAGDIADQLHQDKFDLQKELLKSQADALTIREKGLGDRQATEHTHKDALAKFGQEAAAKLEEQKAGHAKEIAGIHGGYQASIASIHARFDDLHKRVASGVTKEADAQKERESLLKELKGLTTPPPPQPGPAATAPNPGGPTSQPAGTQPIAPADEDQFVRAHPEVDPAIGMGKYHAEIARWKANPQAYTYQIPEPTP